MWAHALHVSMHSVLKSPSSARWCDTTSSSWHFGAVGRCCPIITGCPLSNYSALMSLHGCPSTLGPRIPTLAPLRNNVPACLSRHPGPELLRPNIRTCQKKTEIVMRSASVGFSRAESLLPWQQHQILSTAPFVHCICQRIVCVLPWNPSTGTAHHL